MIEKIKEVKNVFGRIDREIATFQALSGLTCLSGCNLCCRKENIPASVLEFLPLAWYLCSENLHEKVLREIEHGGDQCVCMSHLYVEGKNNGCLYYPYRGMICRLFGFTGIAYKDSRISLYTCRQIKERYQLDQGFYKVQQKNHVIIPQAQNFQFQFEFIDYTLANDIHPINQSIARAITKAAYYYENHPRKKKKRYKKAG